MWAIAPIWPQGGLLMHMLSTFMSGNRNHWPSRGAFDARDVGVQVGQSHPLAIRGATDAMMLAFGSGNQPY